MPSKIQLELETLAAEAREYKNAAESIKDISGQDSGLLFHGTRRGNEITKFNLEKANWGVGCNAWAQGNKGIYLTDDLQAARYFSRKAGELSALMDQSVEPLQRLDKAWEALFGDEDGNIVIASLKPNAKIKELTHYPNKQEIETQAKQGFPGVRFPEKGFMTVEDLPSQIGTKTPFSSKTTFVFDLDVIQIVHSKFNLADFYKQAISQPTSNLSQPPKVIQGGTEGGGKGKPKLVDEQTALNSARRGMGKFLPGEVYEQDLGSLGKRQVLVQGTDDRGNIRGWYLPLSDEAKLLGQTKGYVQEAVFKPIDLQVTDTPTHQKKTAINFLFSEKPRG